MNAGTDYRVAETQAQANADRFNTAYVIVGYGGAWWINRLSSYDRIPDHATLVYPSFAPQRCPVRADHGQQCDHERGHLGPCSFPESVDPETGGILR